MTVSDLIDQLKLEVAAGVSGLDREINGGYCGDLLSDVMGNAPMGCIWLTIQGHQNIVAVAHLRDMAAIVLAAGRAPDKACVQKADAKSIPVLLWPGPCFELAGRLTSMGIAESKDP